MSYQLENVWQSKTQELREEIIQFWVANGALPRNMAEQRVDQVIYLARDVDNQVCGIATVYKQMSPQVGQNFFYYRTFVGPSMRQTQAGTEMVIKTYDFLNERFQEGEDSDALGIFMEVESQIMNTHKKEAIWPKMKMTFIGRDQRGSWLRLRYFEGAEIKA